VSEQIVAELDLPTRPGPEGPQAPEVSRFAGLASSPWWGFLGRRLISLVLILLGLIVVVFFVLRLVPGDPAVSLAGANATPDDIARVRSELGLDLPVYEQFWQYISGLAHGDLGKSYFFSDSVSTVITDRLGSSAQLAAVALVIVLLVSIPGGMLAGVYTRDGKHKYGELGFASITSIIGSLPEFLMATFLALVFAVWLQVLPVAGGEGIQGLVLPAAAVCLRPIAILMRVVRVETLNVLATDYMRTATGKRLPARLLYFRHALPHVVTAALTVGGLLFSGVIGGAVIVENVFARPGLGTALVNAVLAHDYPVVQGVTLVLGVVVVLVTMFVDLLIALIDPRSISGKV
jgi:peptide/nickel transport system permease protein